MKNYTKLLITGFALVGSLLVGGTAFAAGPGMGHWGMGGGVVGTVATVSGNTLTVTSKSFGRGEKSQAQTATTYSVDASGATVMKNGATSTVSAIAVGDTVMVQGTVNGTSVTATVIRDGMPMRGKMGEGKNGDNDNDDTVVGGIHANAPIIQGNGQPVIGGNVTAVSGNTLTVTNKSNITYTVNAASATVTKGGATSTVSSVVVGDNVIVQGAVNGTNITASSVIDQGTVPAGGTSTSTSGEHKPMGRFFGAIGGFFHNLFGFF